MKAETQLICLVHGRRLQWTSPPQASGRNGLLQSPRPQQQIFKWQEVHQHAIACEGHHHYQRSYHGVHKVVVRCRHDRQQDPAGIEHTRDEEGDACLGRSLASAAVVILGLRQQIGSRLGASEVLLIRQREPSLALRPGLAITAVDLLDATQGCTLVDKNASDAESISKMHTWHSCQSVHKVSTHPNRCGVLAVDGIDEAILWGKQARWHAGVEDEDHESKQVAQGHGPTSDRESGESGRHVVVERDEAKTQATVSIV